MNAADTAYLYDTGVYNPDYPQNLLTGLILKVLILFQMYFC